MTRTLIATGVSALIGIVVFAIPVTLIKCCTDRIVFKALALAVIVALITLLLIIDV